jgi:large repetitive protein
MANKDFKVKNGIDIQTPLPVSMGGTGQTSTTNTLNSLLPTQAGNNSKVLQTDGTNTLWYSLPAAYNRGSTGSRPGSPTAGDLYFNTDYNYFEQYTSLGWFPIAAAPGTPTGVTATNQGTGRAYNNGQMSVAFTPNTSAGYPSSFIVTPSPSTSPSTFTGTSSPVTVTGLASSTQYTYTVQATSAYGTSAASSASSGVTATTVPQAPSLSAAEGDSQAIITITPGATGGSAITQYTITSNPATTTQTTSNTTYTFTGLTNGTVYTFTATATNANGTSAASTASNSITAGSNSFESIATYTLTGNQSSISFNSIPSTYTHLQIRAVARTDRSADVTDSVNLRFNSDANSNYSDHFLSGNGSSVSGGATQTTSITGIIATSATSANSNVFGAGVVDILDYTNTNKYKTIRSIHGNAVNIVQMRSGNWRNNSVVSTITLFPNIGTNFVSGSRFALYGVRG